jgi:pyruvate/2-oxoacid:ferredoxin oxidoreductase beta subunit/Pyruvate/2-oxoacid:ferredoxin oxidoreductase gamma subunit
MDSLLNSSRPPVFCPGCAHERVVQALDRAFQNMGLNGHQIVIVSDIGCSGLFDTFFNTHAFHGLHGRALTYATGIKMARPELKVVVTMGDGGLGIGGAHVLSTCRRNIDITLLVLNNFNYGMTGGQCSVTTPPDAVVGSGFLNQLEAPIDICEVAGAAGAGYLARHSTYDTDLPGQIQKAIDYNGFSVVDIWGVCPGRYTKRNRLTPKAIQEALERLRPAETLLKSRNRAEYGQNYRDAAARQSPVSTPQGVEAMFKAPQTGRQEVVILGSAGQRIVTAGELLCLAGISAGMHASQKNDYPITVLRGHSVSELILSETGIGYTGIASPQVVIALAQEGVARRKAMFAGLAPEAVIVKTAGLELPHNAAKVIEVDFKAAKIKSPDWALASLIFMAKQDLVLNLDMLEAGLAHRFKGKVRDQALTLIDRVIG